MGAVEFLADVARTVGERGEQYGDAPRLFADIACRWSAVLELEVSPSQVALCMIDVKLAWLSYDPTHADSIRDIAGYAAILAEIAP